MMTRLATTTFFFATTASISSRSSGFLHNRRISSVIESGVSAVRSSQPRPKTMVPASSSMSSSPSSEYKFSNRVLETLDPCVVLMKQLISKYEHLWEDKGGIYSLAQGVVYWEPPEEAFDYLTKAIKENNSTKLHTYCPDEGLPELRTLLKSKLKEENGFTDYHDVMITSGANQAYVNCILSLMSGTNDMCVVFKPYYFNHVMAIQMSQGNDALVIGSCSDEGIPDIQWLQTELETNDNIRVVTVVNPGNPTGVSLKRDVLQQIVDLCAKHKVWFILDCTYEHFDHIGGNKLDEIPFAGFNEANVIHIFSLSKGHALAGFRCGYIVINTEDSVGQQAFKEMLKVQDTIPICPSRISQTAAMGAMSAGRQWVHKKVDTLKTSRKNILEALQPLEKIMGGTGAMYVMAKLPDGHADDQEVSEQLVERFGIAVIPGSFCGFPGWIRVCYSNLPPAECQLAAKRLSEGILEICGSCHE